MQYTPTHWPKPYRWRVNLIGGQVLTTSETTHDLSELWSNAENKGHTLITVNDLTLRPSHISAMYPLKEEDSHVK